MSINKRFFEILAAEDSSNIKEAISKITLRLLRKFFESFAINLR